MNLPYFILLINKGRQSYVFLILSQALLRVLFYLCNLFVNDQLSVTLCVHLFYFIISAPCFYNLAATMIFEAEVSMTRQLDFNDVHSDVESVAPLGPCSLELISSTVSVSAK